jgi:hypothetical protein
MLQVTLCQLRSPNYFFKYKIHPFIVQLKGLPIKVQMALELH